MSRRTSRRKSWAPFRATAPTALIVAAIWLTVAVSATSLVPPDRWPSLLAIAAVGMAANVALTVGGERLQWGLPLRRIAAQVEALAEKPAAGVEFSGPRQVGVLVRALNGLSAACKRRAEAAARWNSSDGAAGIKDAMTRSALLQANSDVFATLDNGGSGEYGTSDMVSRLEPKLLRWLESSTAEQRFLGWDLRQLREKSFLEIVHPDDTERARAAMKTAAVRGEAHGLVLRIRTADGRAKAIAVDVGARYGPDLTVSHLRCHVTDVTAKIRAERELKLRTRELEQANDQLRLINRELEELKERYRDLYQNAPAMYFSLDENGRVLECNDTLLRTLGYRREAVVGRSYERLMPESRRADFLSRFAAFLKEGSIEIESQWVKTGGEVIDVWLTGTAVRAPDGRLIHSRSVAQDVTARHRLEAELHEKNERLARANAELSRRNREMDEFTYVVSHDLQEPLRTLIAFSDFLRRDHGDRLDAEGREFIGYIVDASRRMRDLIHDLLSLSRAGKVAAEFVPVSLDELTALARADLAELIRSKRAELRVPAPLPEVWGDRARLGQLLSNLVANGLKYNDKPDPWVEVAAATGPDDVVTLAVRDNGIGIEPRSHDTIFQLFRRLHPRGEYEGTGAGLAICSKIIEAHGGRIRVESEPGRGSTFFVTLRRPPPDAARTPAVAVAADAVGPG